MKVMSWTSTMVKSALKFPVIKRFFSSHNISETVDIHKISLRKPLSKSSQYSAFPFTEDKEAKITVLPNGLKVASQNKLGSQCAIGVIVKAGPRYEVNSISGVSHYLEKLGFHSTDVFNDRNSVQETMENCNSIFDCQISRDFIIYAVSGFNTNMDKLTHALSQTVLHSKVTEEEVQMAERSISFELQALKRSPPVEPIINELLHSAAYRGNSTLGLPRYCPEENLGKITRDDVIKFMISHYKPERMVIAGVGVEHDAFVRSVEIHFLPTVHSLSSEPAAKDAPPCDNSVAQYCGGTLKLERDLSQYHAPMPEFAHAAIGLESCSYNDPEFVPACLLHSLLGGGGSFSAGGPGKGMYTRLYLNVLNEHHWVNSAQAENHAYADSGLFTIIGSSSPDYLDHLVQILADELRHVMEISITNEELSRAKHQLQSMLLMNLETRAVNFEDIARQVLTTGTRREPEYWVNRINEVTENDIRDFVHRMIFQSPPTLVGFGRVDKLPSLSDVSRVLNEPSKITTRFTNRIPKLFKHFI